MRSSVRLAALVVAFCLPALMSSTHALPIWFRTAADDALESQLDARGKFPALSDAAVHFAGDVGASSSNAVNFPERTLPATLDASNAKQLSPKTLDKGLASSLMTLNDIAVRDNKVNRLERGVMDPERAAKLDSHKERVQRYRDKIQELPPTDHLRITINKKRAQASKKWRQNNLEKSQRGAAERKMRWNFRKEVRTALATSKGLATLDPFSSFKHFTIDDFLSLLKTTHTSTPPTSLLADVGSQWGVTRPRTKLVGKSNEGNQQTEPRLETAPSETSPHAPVVTEEFKQRRKAKFLELFDSASPPTLSPPASPTNQVQSYKPDLDLNHTPPSSP